MLILLLSTFFLELILYIILHIVCYVFRFGFYLELILNIVWSIEVTSFTLWIYILCSTINWKDCLCTALQYHLCHKSNDPLVGLFLAVFFFHLSTLPLHQNYIVLTYITLYHLYIQKSKSFHLVLDSLHFHIIFCWMPTATGIPR